LLNSKAEVTSGKGIDKKVGRCAMMPVATLVT
jgi:hypothetical protein